MSTDFIPAQHPRDLDGKFAAKSAAADAGPDALVPSHDRDQYRLEVRHLNEMAEVARYIHRKAATIVMFYDEDYSDEAWQVRELRDADGKFVVTITPTEDEAADEDWYNDPSADKINYLASYLTVSGTWEAAAGQRSVDEGGEPIYLLDVDKAARVTEPDEYGRFALL